MSDKQLAELLADVLRFRRGIGKYNIAHMSGQKRQDENDALWYALEARIVIALNERGVKVGGG